MNDVDPGGVFEKIGEIETTMGAIMHARKHTFMDKLAFEGSEKKIGMIIVRAEEIHQTNLTAKFQLEWLNVNNTAGGCLGMCGRRVKYRYTIERLV